MKYTWEEVARHSSPDDCWMVIKGQVYDVSAFWPSVHPGGHLLLDAAGLDATSVFVSNHPTWVETCLSDDSYRESSHIRLLGQVEHDPARKEWQFEEPFYAELKALVDRHPEWRNRYEWRTWAFVGLTVMIQMISWYTAVVRGNVWWLPLSILSWVWNGFHVMHPINHGALSSVRSKWWNGLLFFTYLNGISSILWRRGHHMEHHAFTNHVEDGDIHHAPVLRQCEADRPLPHYRWQSVYMWFVYFFTHASVMFYYLLHTGRVSYSRRSEVWMYYSGVAAMIALYLLVPSHLHSLRYGWLVLSVHIAAGGWIVSVIFGLNHTTGDAEFDSTVHWAENSVRASYNYSILPSRWTYLTLFVVGGLNYQIEHHLLPTVYHIHYPDISPHLRQLCEKYRLSYRFSPNVMHAIRKHQAYMSRLASYSMPLASPSQ